MSVSQRGLSVFTRILYEFSVHVLWAKRCDATWAAVIKRLSLRLGPTYRPEKWAGGVTVGLGEGPSVTPLRYGTAMLTIDESDFTPDHIEFLREWADILGISVEVLLARIVLACSEGDQYVEAAPCLRPTSRE